MDNASKATFKSYKILAEDLTISFHKKPKLKMQQPIAIGFAILELSKLIMQRLYYNVLKPSLDDKVKILMTDTDSFLVLIKERDPDKIVRAIMSHMDFSNYPQNHKLFNLAKKFKVGLLKNEVPSSFILRFCGLRSKTYGFEHIHLPSERLGLTATAFIRQAINVAKKVEFNARAKGVGYHGKKGLNYRDYFGCLKEMTHVTVRLSQLRSRNHIIHLIESTKLAFSSFDDKRYMLCNIHTVPYGSVLIEQSKRLNTGCYFCSFPNMYF